MRFLLIKACTADAVAAVCYPEGVPRVTDCTFASIVCLDPMVLATGAVQTSTKDDACIVTQVFLQASQTMILSFVRSINSRTVGTGIIALMMEAFWQAKILACPCALYLPRSTTYVPTSPAHSRNALAPKSRDDWKVYVHKLVLNICTNPEPHPH